MKRLKVLLIILIALSSCQVQNSLTIVNNGNDQLISIAPYEITDHSELKDTLLHGDSITYFDFGNDFLFLSHSYYCGEIIVDTIGKITNHYEVIYELNQMAICGTCELVTEYPDGSFVNSTPLFFCGWSYCDKVNADTTIEGGNKVYWKCY